MIFITEDSVCYSLYETCHDIVSLTLQTSTLNFVFLVAPSLYFLLTFSTIFFGRSQVNRG